MIIVEADAKRIAIIYYVYYTYIKYMCKNHIKILTILETKGRYAVTTWSLTNGKSSLFRLDHFRAYLIKLLLSSSDKGSTSKRNNLLQRESLFLPFRVEPFFRSGPSCSKVTMSLVNVSLKN